jgi:hypothetical protein
MMLGILKRKRKEKKKVFSCEEECKKLIIACYNFGKVLILKKFIFACSS